MIPGAQASVVFCRAIVNEDSRFREYRFDGNLGWKVEYFFPDWNLFVFFEIFFIWIHTHANFLPAYEVSHYFSIRFKVIIRELK